MAGKYLFKIKTEHSRPYAAGVGDETHDLFERYQKLGEVPVQDRTVADNLLLAGLPYLPPPRTGISEGEARFTHNGIAYAMRRDWRGNLSDLPKGDTASSLRIYGDIPAQLDLKTSSQPLRYGLWHRDPEHDDDGNAWLNNTQAIIEGLELAVRTGSDVISSRWLYLKTPSKTEGGEMRLRGKVEAMPSDIVVGRDALERVHLRVVEPFARGIHEATEAFEAGALKDFRELPFNLNACNDYKSKTNPAGCEFRDLCKGTFETAVMVEAGYAPVQETVASVTNGQGEMKDSMTAPGSLFAQFQNGQAPAPVVGGSPAPAFTPPPAPFVPGGPGVPAPAPAVPAFAAPSAPAAAPAVPAFQGFQGINAPEVRAQTTPAPVAAPVPAPVAAPALVEPQTKPGLGAIGLTKADLIAMLEGALAALRQD